MPPLDRPWVPGGPFHFLQIPSRVGCYSNQGNAMNSSEFDKFADEYRHLHSRNIRVSGESPEFFAEYKVRDAIALAANAGFSGSIRVMDFGAGVGNSVPFFASLLTEATLICVDVSVKSLTLAKQRFPGKADYLTFDGSSLPFASDTFDLVFTACVFHHIPADEHEDLLREILRVLRRSGLFVIFEHNPRNPLTVRAVNNCAFDANAVLIDANALRQRIREVGFCDIHRAYRIFFPRWLRALRNIEPMLSWLPLGAQYFIAARKESGD